MKIAVTYKDGEIFQHFGHTEYFKLYEVADGKVVDTTVVSTEGNGHGALANFLKGHQVTKLICGGIGGGAKTALEEGGIEFFAGVTGDADKQVEALLKGELVHNPDTECNHHGHGHKEDGHHHHGGEGHGHCGKH